MSHADVPGPNDPTRTRAPQPADAPPGPNDPTRTRAPGASDANAGTEPPARNDRLPAPLQYRDPDRYQVIGEHGRGGLGRVLRARDKELGRDVAVKELLERSNTSELRFFREALITARLEHPGIVPVHEAGRWPDGTPFYAMKLVQGRPLRALIDDCKSLEDRLALIPHVIAVADAIAYAHDRKIIHRDLKPSNVIVGDFGETVVIDWGLAKDITDEIPEPTQAEAGATRAPAADGLTVAGSVLGTPAYMAPEQHEGRADERSDIYALGGIIQHVLTGAVPNADGGRSPSTQPRALRRAQVAGLVAIQERAMNPSPEGRYQEVRELAADLRRFSQHRPVGAKRYSIAAKLLLGAARHRAASLVVISALVLISGLLAFDVVRVRGQRFRAEAAERVAEDARAEAERSLASSVLKNAELILAKDPTAALDALSEYRGDDRRAEQLRVEALARGVATMRASPHRGNTRWIAGLPDGSVASLSNDGSVARTSPAGRVDKIAQDAQDTAVHAWCPRRHLLVYACGEAEICLADLTKKGIARFSQSPPTSLDCSPDETRIAIVTRDRHLVLIAIEDIWHPRVERDAPISGGVAFFARGNDIAAAAPEGVDLIGESGLVSRVAVPHARLWVAEPATGKVLVVSLDGDATLVDVASRRVRATRHLCDDAIYGVVALSVRRTFGYVCKSGAVGEWGEGMEQKVLFQTSGYPVEVVSSDDGEYIVTSTDRGLVRVFDFATGTVATYAGHSAPVTALAAPMPGGGLIASGDSEGNVRAWSTPLRGVHRLQREEDSFTNVVFGADPRDVIAVSGHGALLECTSMTECRSGGPHEAGNTFLQRSPDGNRVATFGTSAYVEIWRTNPLTLERVIDTGRNALADVRFWNNSGAVVVAGTDGRIVRWGADDHGEQLADVHAELDRLRVAGGGVIVFSDRANVWRLESDGMLKHIYHSNSEIMQVQVSADGAWIAVGAADGSLAVVDHGEHVSEAGKFPGGVRDIRFSADGALMAVSIDTGIVVVARRIGSTWTRGLVWRQLQLPCKRLTFVESETLVAASQGGVIWTYDLGTETWAAIVTEGEGFRSLAYVEGSGNLALVTTDGELLVVDLSQ